MHPMVAAAIEILDATPEVPMSASLPHAEPQFKAPADQRAEYDRLCAVARDKGYKSGWVAYRFKDAYGEFPPKEWQKKDAVIDAVKGAAPKQPAHQASSFRCPSCGWNSNGIAVSEADPELPF